MELSTRIHTHTYSITAAPPVPDDVILNVVVLEINEFTHFKVTLTLQIKPSFDLHAWCLKLSLCPFPLVHSWNQRSFREATADAVNAYCEDKECPVAYPQARARWIDSVQTKFTKNHESFTHHIWLDNNNIIHNSYNYHLLYYPPHIHTHTPQEIIDSYRESHKLYMYTWSCYNVFLTFNLPPLHTYTHTHAHAQEEHSHGWQHLHR